MISSFSLEGKKALVTGGSRGIGFAAAQAMARAGAEIVIAARLQAQLDKACETLAGKGFKVSGFSHDMSDIEGIQPLYDRIISETGGIDILVNNAGGTRRGPAEIITEQDWDFVMDLNAKAVFTMCKAFAKERITAKRPGKIINIASLMSETVRRDNAPYAASKGAVRQLTKALAVDWARYHINVNCFGPGYIRTELTRALWEDPEFDAWIKQRTPMGRWGTPEDLAPTVVFLASPASDFITGQIFFVDGGLLSMF
ncbi:MAG: glucose 1-dehydrogenase [Desulfobacterales bacterium]|nr:glucose 1-dehydrogenase [Desulfobacterales bacterium]